MAYSSWSVTFGEQPSAAKWNILGTNDASFNDGTGIAAGVITPDKLNSAEATSWNDQSWTPTFGGFSVAPTITHARYIRAGKMCSIWLRALGGTSNATTFTFVLPFAVSANITTGVVFPILAQDNGSIGSTPGRADIAASSTTCSLFTNYAGGVWTGSGTKGAILGFTYPTT